MELGRWSREGDVVSMQKGSKKCGIWVESVKLNFEASQGLGLSCYWFGCTPAFIDSLTSVTTNAE